VSCGITDLMIRNFTSTIVVVVEEFVVRGLKSSQGKHYKMKNRGVRSTSSHAKLSESGACLSRAVGEVPTLL
jgi:hypothetical protein